MNTPYRPAVSRTYAVGDVVKLNGMDWKVIAVNGDTLTLASMKSFEEDNLKDLDALISTLLTDGQLKLMVPGVSIADDSTAATHFGGETGHIVIRTDKRILA